MANEKIKYSDLIEKEAIPRLISELKLVEDAMNDVAKSAKSIVEQSAKIPPKFQGYENLKDVQEGVDKVKKAVDTLRTAEDKRKKALTEREKLEKRLAVLKTDEAKAIAILKVKIAEETKELKRNASAKQIAEAEKAKAVKKAEAEKAKAVQKSQAEQLKAIKKAQAEQAKAIKQAQIEADKAAKAQQKEAELLANKYKVLTKATNEAQAEFKKLAAEFGINSKEAQEAYKQFVRLDDQLREINDTARDGRRDVGRYRIATEKLGKSMKALQAIGIITMLAKIGEFFSANEAGGMAMEKMFGRITVTLKVFITRLVTLIPLATNNLKSLSIQILIIGKNIEIFYDSIQGYIKSIGDFSVEVLSFLGPMASKIKEAFDDAFPDSTSEKAEGLRKEIEELKKQQDALGGGLTIEAMTKAFEGMGDEIADLIDKNDKLIKATNDYEKRVMKLSKEEADLLAKRELLASQAEDDTLNMEDMARANEELMKVEQQLADKRLEIAKGAMDIANARVEVDKGNLGLQKEATQAYIALQEAKAEADNVQLKIAMEKRKTERDIMEQDLDILLDVSDRRKTVGEQHLLDETLTLKARKEAFEQYSKDIENTFREQVKTIEKTRGTVVPIDELLAIEDTIELNKRLKELGLNEIETKRLREVIMERIQANEDLRKSTLDLTKAEEKEKESRLDITEQEKAIAEMQKSGVDLNKVLEALADRRTEIEIQNLRDRLAIATDGSQQALDIQQELNNKLLAQAQKQKEKELAIEKEKAEARKQLAENTGEFLINLSKEISERRLADIDEALEASAMRESELLELATQGSQDAVEALAFERRAQAELALQREKEIERQARRELALSGAKIFGAKVASGIPAGQALAQTGAELLALQELVNSLPSFWEGAERVGDELPATIAGRDGHLVRVDGGERVMPTALNNVIPRGMSNLELAMLAREKVTPKKQDDNIGLLAKKLDNVEKAIRQQPVLTDRVFDADRQAVISTTKRGQALERRHRSLGING